jgi:hypothetical protein
MEIMTQLPILKSVSQSRGDYVFLKISAFFFFCSLVLWYWLLEILDHLASPSGPQQMCAVLSYWIAVLKFRFEFKERESLRKMMCPIWWSILAKILWTEINLFARFETMSLPTIPKWTVSCVVFSLLISSWLFHSVS